MKVHKHGGRAHPDGSSGLGWSSKYDKYMRAEMIEWLSRDG